MSKPKGILNDESTLFSIESSAYKAWKNGPKEIGPFTLTHEEFESFLTKEMERGYRAPMELIPAQIYKDVIEGRRHPEFPYHFKKYSDLFKP